MKKKIRDKISATTKLTHWTKTKSQKEIDEIQSRRVAKMVGKHWKLSAKTKKKQSLARLGTHPTEVTKQKLRDYMIAHPVNYWLGKKRPGQIGDLNPAKRREVREKISIKRRDQFLKKDFTFKGYFFSQKNNAMIGYRSVEGELRCMEIFEQLPNLDHYTYESDAVPYRDENGQKRFTIPDFHLYWKDGTETVIEYKPHWKLQRDDLKIQAMRKYSTENGWDFNVWSEENINIK